MKSSRTNSWQPLCAQMCARSAKQTSHRGPGPLGCSKESQYGLAPGLSVSDSRCSQEHQCQTDGAFCALPVKPQQAQTQPRCSMISQQPLRARNLWRDVRCAPWPLQKAFVWPSGNVLCVFRKAVCAIQKSKHFSRETTPAPCELPSGPDHERE